MNLVFISDQHISDPKHKKCQSLLMFFRGLQGPQDCTDIFLLGDFFDLWVAGHQYFIDRYKDILSELVRLKCAGAQIHMFEGNHDLYLTEYFGQHLGFKIYPGPVSIQMGTQRLRLEHGDQMDPEDRGYIFLRWFLRTCLMKWIARNLPTSWVIGLGQWASHKSRDYTSKIKTLNVDRALQITRSHALKVYREAPFDILICGHTHVPMDEFLQIGDQRLRLINLGFQAEPLKITVRPE